MYMYIYRYIYTEKYVYIQGNIYILKQIYRVSTKGGTESSNLYLGYQTLQKMKTGINVKQITPSFCGIQDAAEI